MLFHKYVTQSGHNCGHMALKRSGIIEKKRAQGITYPVRPRLLPLKQAAEYLGLSLWAIRERVWSGDLPVVKFNNGRKMFIDREDIEDFIESNKMRIT